LVAGPPNMPNDIRDTLSSALIKALADPAVVAWAKQADVELRPETAAQAAQILADQEQFFQKWKKYLTSG
jgi:tripartite-type tricarboxylate transporter receptor subunit TctC